MLGAPLTSDTLKDRGWFNDKKVECHGLGVRQNGTQVAITQLAFFITDKIN